MEPRGIRNNNPGNIRFSERNDWVGQSHSDGSFCVFTHSGYGIRAMTKLLLNYRKRGKNTVKEIIKTWAPASENDTKSYIKSVAKRVGISPDDVLDDSHMPGLVAAIIHHENGKQPYTEGQIKAGMRLAGWTEQNCGGKSKD